MLWRNHSLSLCLWSIFPDVSVVIPVLPGTTGQRLALSLEDCMTPKSVCVNQSVCSCSVWVWVYVNWNWVCVWQAADPTPLVPVSIMSTALAHPARVFRTLLSVYSSVLMGTRHPILRTNTLVWFLKRGITMLAISMSLFRKWCYCFLCLPLQVNAHTACPPSRIRSWLSCTRTDLWRQLSPCTQTFCCTNQVRLGWLISVHVSSNSETVCWSHQLRHKEHSSLSGHDNLFP